MAIERFGPLDDFEKDDQHRQFEEALKRMGRLEPKVEDEPSSSLKLRDVPEAQPAEIREAQGSVVVSVGRGDLTVTYSVETPADYAIVGRRVPDKVVEAFSALHGASIRARDPGLDIRARSIAILIKAGAAERLLEFGRLDLIKANRFLVNDGNLPGLNSGRR